MKLPSPISLGTAALAFVSFACNVYTAPALGSTLRTTFNCVEYDQNSNTALVVSRGTRQATMIMFTVEGSSEFGEAYSPQTRCNIVSRKFANTVDLNGGTLRNVLMTNGIVNSRQVICALGRGEHSCNETNQLFTLNSENAQNPGRMLGQLLQVSQNADPSAVIWETSDRVVVDLGKWEESMLGNALPQDNSPSSDPSSSPEVEANDEPTSTSDSEPDFAF